MGSIKDDIRLAFQRKDDYVIKLVILNLLVFSVCVLVYVFALMSLGKDGGRFFYYAKFQSWFGLSTDASVALYKPWTIISYSFMHSMNRIGHILMNCLMLYWFGRIVQDLVGKNKILGLYVTGAIVGGIFCVLGFHFMPHLYNYHVSTLVGASASVTAIVVAAAVFAPDYKLHLFFIGPVKLKWLALVSVLLSFLGSVGGNSGGNFAHLGGALMGFIYAKELQKGRDWGKWVIVTVNWFGTLFKPQPKKMKVTYRSDNKTKTKTTAPRSKKEKVDNPNQDEIDRILDKISQSGYESLTKDEKQKLFNASKN